MLDKRNTVVQEVCGKEIVAHMGLPTAKEVDRAWRAFWARRGQVPPPDISSITVGAFNLPTQRKFEHLDGLKDIDGAMEGAG
jgi:hypothetical protein